MSPSAVDYLLLTLVAVVAVAVIRLRSLFAAVMLASVYSLLMALLWYSMAAMDVAFTEAAVGAGISTVLQIAALAFVGREEQSPPRLHWPALGLCVTVGLLLLGGIAEMPRFGDPDAPMHRYVAPEYIEQRVGHGGRDFYRPRAVPPYADMGRHVPNQVTAVLASYRGYDTMFETAVIFTAGLSLILLRGMRRARRGWFPRRRKG